MLFVNGPIGSGKTSLTKILSRDLNTHSYLEDPNKIPMLKAFYNDGKMSRELQSYGVQIEFLTYRYQQLLEGIFDQQNGMRNTVYDSSLISDGLMSKNLYNRGEFPKQLYLDYRKLSQIMQSNVAGHPWNGPDLMISLQLPFDLMLEHIQHRGRKMENTDPKLVDYYKSVWNIYREWTHSYPDHIMTVDLGKYDFVHRPEDRKAVLEDIENNMGAIGLLTANELLELDQKHDANLRAGRPIEYDPNTAPDQERERTSD